MFDKERSKPEKILLDSELLKNLESKNYRCPECHSSGQTVKLRFFAINQEDEIFKCESRHCMFPHERIIFRKRNTNEYFKYKSPIKSPPSKTGQCSKSESDNVNFEIETIIDSIDQPAASNSNALTDILDDLFPDNFDVCSEKLEKSANKVSSPEKRTPMPQKQASDKKSPVLKKSLELLRRDQVKRTIKFNIPLPPKKIMGRPLDLVKDLIKAKKNGIKIEVSPDQLRLNTEPKTIPKINATRSKNKKIVKEFSCVGTLKLQEKRKSKRISSMK